MYNTGECRGRRTERVRHEAVCPGKVEDGECVRILPQGWLD